MLSNFPYVYSPRLLLISSAPFSRYLNELQVPESGINYLHEHLKISPKFLLLC